MDPVSRSRKPPDPRWRLLVAHRANRRPSQHDRSQRWIALGAIGLALATAATAAVSAFSVIRSDEANREQLQIAERERFTTANEQLASDKLEVRLGANYALEQIMRAASNYYEDPIIGILSAYIRSHASKTNTDITGLPAIDVQAALTVLGQRPDADSHRSPDLSHSNLVGVDLVGVDLVEANLTGTDLVEADLHRAKLLLARMSRADLHEANLLEADLTGANLTGANLTKANLIGANLHGANLTAADLTGANLTGANLTEANLTGANLHGAVMP